METGCTTVCTHFAAVQDGRRVFYHSNKAGLSGPILMLQLCSVATLSVRTDAPITCTARSMVPLDSCSSTAEASGTTSNPVPKNSIAFVSMLLCLVLGLT